LIIDADDYSFDLKLIEREDEMKDEEIATVENNIKNIITLLPENVEFIPLNDVGGVALDTFDTFGVGDGGGFLSEDESDEDIIEYNPKLQRKSTTKKELFKINFLEINHAE